ncbi:hypothetical protein LINPERHAP2_LOCUS4157 [Linum perenne]
MVLALLTTLVGLPPSEERGGTDIVGSAPTTDIVSVVGGLDDSLSVHFLGLPRRIFPATDSPFCSDWRVRFTNLSFNRFRGLRFSSPGFQFEFWRWVVRSPLLVASDDLIFPLCVEWLGSPLGMSNSSDWISIATEKGKF